VYIPTIHGDVAVLKQGIVKIDWPRLDYGNTRSLTASYRGFLELFCQASNLWRSLPIASASVRMTVFPDMPPVSWHAIATDVASEMQLRLAIAAFMRLDGMNGANVSAPTSVDDFESKFLDEDDSWMVLDRTPASTSSGGQVFSGISLFDLLFDVFAKGRTLGYRVEYQTAIMPLRPSPHLIGAVRKSIAFLRRETSAPAPLIARQSEIATRLANAGYFAEEAVRIAPEGRDWLAAYVTARANDEIPILATNPHAIIQPMKVDRASAFGYHVHPDVLLHTGTVADALESVDGFMAVAAAERRMRCEPFWRTPDHDELRPLDSPITALFSTIQANSGREPASGDFDRAPRGGGSAGTFMFVSYSHKDRGQIKPILDDLVQRGVRLWIDSEIDVGEEWDTRLETQLTACAGLIAFVSNNYIASKHCRRELKFADALDKLILASSFTAAPLTGGLGYIFASLQFVATGQTDVAAALIRTIQLKMPRVFTGGGAHA
jgi:hypothetical protein